MIASVAYFECREINGELTGWKLIALAMEFPETMEFRRIFRHIKLF